MTEPGHWTANSLSTKGASHIRKSIPCQDASASGTLNPDGWAYAIVADGHGSPSYFRSDVGARMAVEVLEEAFRAVAVASSQTPSDQGAPRITPKLWPEWAPLQVVSAWRSRVWADLLRNPPSLSDSSDIEPSLERFLDYTRERRGYLSVSRLADQIGAFESFAQSRPEALDGEPLPLPTDDMWDQSAYGTWQASAYGTTLLGVLAGPEAIYLFRQGDGAMVEVRDGTASYLLEPSSEAIANQTPSMCDVDAVIQLDAPARTITPPGPTAMIVTTDGIPNSYSTLEGFWAFCSEIAEIGIADPGLPEKLAVWLPEISADGSGDDVSIALLLRQSADAAASRQEDGDA